MDVCAVVLAAGLGTRLRPLTDLRPKALCPVNNVPLVDDAIARARTVTDAVAVNVHHHREQLVAHLGDTVHISIEADAPLGTAGAIGNLKRWIDGRPALILNADSWHAERLEHLMETWDGTTPRLLVTEDRARPDFEGRWRFTGACLLPARIVERLPVTFSGLFHEVFSREPLEFVASAEPFFDCGTIADYHAANMAASGGASVVGEGALVQGTVERCVLWPGVTVARDEHLVDAVRASDDVTVFVR